MTLPESPTLLELLPMFVDHWEQEVAVAWPRMAAARDADALRRLGHTAKGSFAQFELHAGAEAGEALLVAAGTADWARAEAVLDGLRAYLADLRGALAAAGYAGEA